MEEVGVLGGDKGGGEQSSMPPPDMSADRSNTGPKGVISDYMDTKQKMQILQQMKIAEEWEKVDNGMVAATLQEQKEMERKALERKEASFEQEKKRNDEEDDHDDDEDDDEFMKSYREKRLQELKEEHKEAMKKSMMPTFGTLQTIAAERLSDCVEKEHPETFVIVHLYENHVKECAILNGIFSALARKLAYTKFVKILSSDAVDLPDDVLPTVLVFKGGEQIKTWVRFIDVIRPLNEDTVTAWLLKEKVLTLDEEQQERLSISFENGEFDFDKTVQLVDPKLLLSLTQVLR